MVICTVNILSINILWMIYEDHEIGEGRRFVDRGLHSNMSDTFEQLGYRDDDDHDKIRVVYL